MKTKWETKPCSCLQMFKWALCLSLSVGATKGEPWADVVTVLVVHLADIHSFLPSSLVNNRFSEDPEAHGYVELVWTLWSDMWQERPKNIPSKGLVCWLLLLSIPQVETNELTRPTWGSNIRAGGQWVDIEVALTPTSTGHTYLYPLPISTNCNCTFLLDDHGILKIFVYSLY